MRQQLCYIWVCAAEGDLASDSVLAGGLRVTHEYDLTQKDKMDEYWAAWNMPLYPSKFLLPM